jgi:hypothetical protein
MGGKDTAHFLHGGLRVPILHCTEGLKVAELPRTQLSQG